MCVGDVMTGRPACCRPDTDLQEVAWLMLVNDCGAILVVERFTETVVGIITDRDVVTRAVAWGQDPRLKRAEDVMSTPVATVSPGARLDDCMNRMAALQVRRMPVVGAGGTPCGIVSLADVAGAGRVYEKQLGHLVRALHVPPASCGVDGQTEPPGPTWQTG